MGTFVAFLEGKIQHYLSEVHFSHPSTFLKHLQDIQGVEEMLSGQRLLIFIGSGQL